MSDAQKAVSAVAHNQSTEKALAIIEALADYGAPMRLTDIAHALGYNQSTSLRFLSTLINTGYVAQDSESQKYYLTYKISRIANKLNTSGSIPSITHPQLVRLSEFFGESACVSVEQQHQMVYIDVATRQDQMLLSMQQVGNTVPMHCTGNGKLVLSTFTPQQIDDYIAEKGMKRFTPKTITTRDALMAELSAIRQNGFALDDEECETGARCIAYPIRNYTGSVIAGISVTGPVSRLTKEIIAKKQHYIQAAATEISISLGYEDRER